MRILIIALSALLLAASSTLAAPAAPAAKSDTEITYYGHSAFKIVTPAGKVLLIDPWITNPNNPNGEKDLEALNKVDLILLTHGHGDHVGNMVQISKRTGAKLVTTPELMKAAVLNSFYPVDNTANTLTGAFGGEISLLDGEVTVRFVPAVHGGSMEIAEGSIAPRSLVYAGWPSGFYITVKNGPRIYHTGDTDLFGDMTLIGDVDVMLVCIGGKFTMGPQRAAQAVRLVKPKMVIPMHYNTWEIMAGTPEQFKSALNTLGIKSMKQLNPSEVFRWK
ncbi:MAG: metal-dependent hydrolase [Deltaproteobacteria bacterium]|nr:metal-dependent hydrolase [Deltaproteobacteria bacterium]